MNLLFFIETGCGNGRAMADELIAIDKTKKVNVFSASSSKDQEEGIIESITDHGIENLLFNEMEEHKHFKEHVKLLRTFIKKNEIDIVHVQTNWQLLLTSVSIIGLKKKTRIIYTIHGYRNNKNICVRSVAHLLIFLELFLLADKVIATCSFLQKKFSWLKYKMQILPLGVDTVYLRQNFVKQKDLRIIFPAMFRQGKHQEILITAFYNYIQATGDVNSKVCLPGEGERMNDCKILTKHLKIDNQIIFPGKCTKKELLCHYNDSNIVVCTSSSETFCQTLVEAYCLGKCIITRRVGVADDIIKNKKNGFFFEDVNELQKLFVQLKENPKSIETMGAFNYAQRQNYSWDVIASEYIKMINTF